MRTPHRTMIAVATALIAVTITGCSSSQPTPAPSRHTNTATPVPVPSAAATLSTDPLTSGSAGGTYVRVYDAGTFTSTVDCRCSLKDDELGVDVPDLFPRGTTVWMLRIGIRESWNGSLDLTGTKVSAQFADRPEAAVLDSKEAPAKAARLGMPWQVAGLIKHHGQATITGPTWQSFLLAYRVPAGSTQLTLTVDVPASKAADVVEIPVPAAVQQAALHTQGAHE